MKLVSLIRLLIPLSLKNYFRRVSLKGRVSKILSPYLPTAVCIDVGASYYPHITWLILLNSPRVQWLAVEPNEANLSYAIEWPWASHISVCNTGLSYQGGEQILYLTNVDTGSSLLPPVITPSMKHRVRDLNYFYPVNEKLIETITLCQAIESLSKEAPIFIKLDTQGTELSIIKGAQSLFDQRRIVGIEMESTLLAQPVMKGSGKFWQACEYLEQQEFELLHIKPIFAGGRSTRSNINLNTYLNECDAIFALRPDIAAKLTVEYRTSLLAFYLTNLFFDEALSLLERDSEVEEFLINQGCRVTKLKKVLKAEI